MGLSCLASVPIWCCSFRRFTNLLVKFVIASGTVEGDSRAKAVAALVSHDNQDNPNVERKPEDIGSDSLANTQFAELCASGLACISTVFCPERARASIEIE